MMADANKTTEDRHWHLDKKVPLALIAAIIVQTAGLSWWASSLSERVNSLERTVQAMAPQGGQIIRLEVQLENLTQTAGRIERMLRARADP